MRKMLTMKSHGWSGHDGQSLTDQLLTKTIDAQRDTFSCCGLEHQLATDNGQQLTSVEFEKLHQNQWSST